MLKTFLILTTLQMFLYSSQQIILVVSDDINSSYASLTCYENSKEILKPIKVNIGKNGFGLGLGIEFENISNINTSIKKFEGDKRAPIGVFHLTHIFGYAKENNFKMPYIHAAKNLICVDDSAHKNYNQIIKMPKIKPKSFEQMRRDDNQYELGIVIEHNKQQIKKRGSCIFMHVQKSTTSPTAGCTAMSLEDLKKITNWLDINKNPILIQTPKSLLPQILKSYPQLSK